MARTIIKTERVPGQNRELITYSDNTQEAIDRPQGYFGTPQTPETPTPTTDQAPKVVYNPDGSRSVLDDLMKENAPLSKADYEAQQKSYKDEQAKILQDRLSAIDNMYAGILAKADETARDKVGSVHVINSLSGQRGSASGSRNVYDVNKYNEQVRNSILAEKQDKINSIMSEHYKTQDEKLAKERELRQKDLDTYISYLGEKEKDKISKSQKMRADLIAGGIQISDIPEDKIKEMADAGGYTVDQFKALYNAEIKSNEEDFVKSEQKRLLELKKLEQEVDVKSNTDKAMVEKGYAYIKTPAERDALKQAGYDVVELNGRTYAKKSEALLLAEKKAVESKYKSPKNTSNEKAAITEMTNAINQVTGEDGFISPEDHALLRKQWIDSGLNVATFDSKFKGYLNPNNPNYVTNKQ